ncbi:MAG: META domain-containing protein, partial [Chloroflexota bacterium]|nr:META domain-containing protein [Chloroflexota bacterium]
GPSIVRTRSVIVGAIVIAASLVGCSVLSGGGTGGQLVGPIWVLTAYQHDGVTTEVPAGVTADAEFQAPASTVRGSAGCNSYQGSYTASGAELTFGVMTTTLMACVGPASEVEAAFLANLAAARTYTATPDSLTIFDDGGAAILVYAPAAPTALEGVTWHATGINNGAGGVASVVDGTDPTATFDAAGTVAGDAGCNQYNGAAVVDGNSIAIGPLASTKRLCADEAANTQENAFLAALQAATTFEARAGRMELRDAGGALQVSFEAR